MTRPRIWLLFLFLAIVLVYLSGLPSFRKDDHDRFVIVPLQAFPHLQSQLTEPIIFRDHRWAVLWHAANSENAP